MPNRVEIIGLTGVPMVQPGDDLAALAISALVAVNPVGPIV